MKQKYQQLLEAMYLMFKDSSGLDLDMEDYQVMWEALMQRWGIEPPSEWEVFLDKINSSASESYKYFEVTFWQYFYIKPLKLNTDESI
jgi:hypothetical protein